MSKPNHSETFKARANNPNHNVKTEAEHKAHFIMRFKERFDIDLSDEQYYAALNHVIEIAPTSTVYKLSENSSIVETTIEEKNVWVIYGKRAYLKESGEFLPARLKTVLIPYQRYMVPVGLARKYDHTMFTEKVTKTMQLIKNVSLNINPAKPKSMKMVSQVSPHLKSVLLSYNKDGVFTRDHIRSIIAYLKK